MADSPPSGAGVSAVPAEDLGVDHLEWYGSLEDVFS
jgi:hypothetical protein